MKMIASRKFYYNGRLLKPAEEFNEPNAKNALDMIAVGQARAVNNSKKSNGAGTYKRRDMRAEE